MEHVYIRFHSFHIFISKFKRMFSRQSQLKKFFLKTAAVTLGGGTIHWGGTAQAEMPREASYMQTLVYSRTFRLIIVLNPCTELKNSLVSIYNPKASTLPEEQSLCDTECVIGPIAVLYSSLPVHYNSNPYPTPHRITHHIRGLKAKSAVEFGASGLLIYSDPQQDGYTQGKAYPDGNNSSSYYSEFFIDSPYRRPVSPLDNIKRMFHSIKFFQAPGGRGPAFSEAHYTI